MSNKVEEKTMKTAAKRELKPKRRFPEFWEAGEWTNALLGNLLIGSPDYGVNAAAVPFADNLPKYLRITDISEEGQYLPDKQVSVDLDATDQNYLDEGDIVLARTGASVGKSYRYRKEDGKLVFAGFLIRVKPDPTLLISTYLANFLTTGHFWKWVAVTSARSGQPGINSTEYSSLAIPLPPNLSEQKKIADCLFSLHERITGEAQKLDTLKTHKKGLMQQLFPAEGETVPKLRFPEFCDEEEWELKEFSKYIVLYRGSSPRPIQNYLTSGSSGVNWIKIGDTKNAKNFIISQVEERITSEGAKKSRKVNIGELILANSMSYGKTYQVAIAGYIYDGWFVLRDYEKHFDKHFLLQLLNSEYMQNQYERFSAGGIVQNISSDIVYKTALPKTSLKEQQKIADCLASLDNLITAQTQKLAALKTHKKGLMQQLFPAADEVSN
jgi:type I restriction enzyme S subunit